MIITNNIDSAVSSILKYNNYGEKFIFGNTAEDLRQVESLYKTTIQCVVIIKNLTSDSILAIAENGREGFNLYAVNLKLPDNLAIQSRFRIEYQYGNATQLAERYLATHRVDSECYNLAFFISLADFISDYDKLKQLQQLINYVQSATTNILWQDIFRRLGEIV